MRTLREWQNDSRFFIITGRPDCWVPPMAAWLKCYEIPYEAILNTQEMTDKGRLAKENSISLFIEDHADAALSIADNGIKMSCCSTCPTTRPAAIRVFSESTVGAKFARELPVCNR